MNNNLYTACVTGGKQAVQTKEELCLMIPFGLFFLHTYYSIRRKRSFNAQKARQTIEDK